MNLLLNNKENYMNLKKENEIKFEKKKNIYIEVIIKEERRMIIISQLQMIW